MSEFTNPFSQLIKREYNPTNLKKVLEVFPQSLDTEQLTSTELLERLRNLIEDKDIRIEELESLLEQQSAGDDLSEIRQRISDLTGDLNLEGLVKNAAKSTTENVEKNSLVERGFKRMGDTPLYVKVESMPTSDGYEFNMNHTNEPGGGIFNTGGGGFPDDDLKSPRVIRFANTSDDKDVWIKKVEDWKKSEDTGGNVPTNPTNVFNFDTYPDIYKRAGKVPAGKEVSTNLSVYYDSKDDYKYAGLTRDGSTNTWFGDMLLKVKVGSSDGIDSVDGVDIGGMRLYRDIN